MAASLDMTNSTDATEANGNIDFIITFHFQAQNINSP